MLRIYADYQAMCSQTAEMICLEALDKMPAERSKYEVVNLKEWVGGLPFLSIFPKELHGPLSEIITRGKKKVAIKLSFLSSCVAAYMQKGERIEEDRSRSTRMYF